MHFDDRLATVLRHRATGERAARTQYRQLFDLLGEPPAGRDKSLEMAAFLRLEALSDSVSVADRARIVREGGSRIRNPGLIRWIGDAESDVAAPALARASLTDEEWTKLIPLLPIRSRGLLRHRRNMPARAQVILDRLGIHDRALPLPASTRYNQEETSSSPDAASGANARPLSGATGENESSENESEEDLSPLELTEEALTEEAGIEEPASQDSPPEQDIKAGEDDTPALTRLFNSIPPLGAVFGSAPNARGNESDNDENGQTGQTEAENGETVNSETRDEAVRSSSAADRQNAEQSEPQEASKQPASAQSGPAPVSLTDIDQPASDDQEMAEEREAAAKPPASSAAPTSSHISEISVLVDRIEAFSRARQTRSPDLHSRQSHTSHLDRAPRLPLDDYIRDPKSNQLGSFVFGTDTDGKINWAEPAIAPMISGTDISQIAEPSGSLARALKSRQPIRSEPVELAGAVMIEGAWIIDAAPRFGRRNGRFSGYVGRFRRAAEASNQDKIIAEAEKLRQLLHELRTPVTAIQGFAEVIQQQLFGATPHEYRALAATVASDAARMLAGFDEIDRLVKLESHALQLDDGISDFADIAKRQIAQLQSVLTPRMARLEAEWPSEDMPQQMPQAIPAGQIPLAMGQADCETLSWRLFATLGSALGAGETIAIKASLLSAAQYSKQQGSGGDRPHDPDATNWLHLMCDLPASLAAVKDIFSADTRLDGGALSPGLFGAGFALRLVRAEVRAGGGDLVREEDTLTATFPISPQAAPIPPAADENPEEETAKTSFGRAAS